MGIAEIINSGATVSLTVGANDLRDFAQAIAEKTRQEIEKEVAENKGEVYYTAEQVCGMLSIDISTLWRWNKRDYLTPIKVGGLRRFRRSDINRILEHGKKQSA
jgi:predicted DNA-binding transcriptional regulator AlpA